MRQPEGFIRFNQSTVLSPKSEGICLGMCNQTAEHAPYIFYGDSQSSFFRLTHFHRSSYFISTSHFEQIKCEQIDNSLNLKHLFAAWNSIVKPPFSTGQPYLIHVSLSQTFGHFTRYSLASYINPFAYVSDHVCFMIGINEDIILFDPNKGVAIWKNLPISSLDTIAIQSLLDVIVHDFPIHVTSIRKYWIKSKSPMSYQV